MADIVNSHKRTCPNCNVEIDARIVIPSAARVSKPKVIDVVLFPLMDENKEIQMMDSVRKEYADRRAAIDDRKWGSGDILEMLIRHFRNTDTAFAELEKDYIVESLKYIIKERDERLDALRPKEEAPVAEGE